MGGFQHFRLHCKLFDLKVALELSNSFSCNYNHYDNKGEWASVISGLLRVYHELDEARGRQEIYDNVIDLYKNGVVCASLYQILGRYYFEKSALSESFEMFAKSKQIAISKQQMNSAVIGLVISDFYKNEFQKCLDLLSSVDVTTADLEMRISVLIWSAQCHLALKQFDLTVQCLIQAKEVCQQDRNFYLLTQTIMVEIELNNLLGKFNESANLIKFVRSIMPSTTACKTLERLNYVEGQIDAKQKTRGFELIESESLVKLVRPDRQSINITQHHQMIQLLRKLTQAKGKQTSKEEICSTLWGREYHPFDVDNKIYVAIKRLRKLIQDDPKQPQYILKREDGYCWNSEIQFTWFQHKHFVDNTDLG